MAQVHPECVICADPIDGAFPSEGYVKQTTMRARPLTRIVSTLEWGCPHQAMLHPECIEEWVNSSTSHVPRCPICRCPLRVVSEEATPVIPSSERFCVATTLSCVGGMCCTAVLMLAL